jgi:flavin-binding protein dodecin
LIFESIVLTEWRSENASWPLLTRVDRDGPPGSLTRSWEGDGMSVYRVIDVIGTSSESWEDAAATAIKTAGQSVRELRVGEVVEQDIHVTDGGALVYRTKLRLSFKYETQQ